MLLAPVSGRRPTFPLRWLGVALCVLALIAASAACTNRPTRRIPSANAGTLPAPANANGVLNVHDSTRPADDPANDPKVCTFYLVAFNFDPNTTISWTISTQPGGAFVQQGTIALDGNGHGRTPDMTLPDGMYKVETPQGQGQGTQSKVFQVACASPSPTPTVSPTVVPPTPTPTETSPSPGTSPTAEESESPSPVPSPTPTPTPTPTETTPTPMPTETGSPGPTPSPTRSPEGGGGQGGGGGTGGGGGAGSGGNGGGSGTGGNGSQVGGGPSGGVGTGGGGTSGIEDLGTIVLGGLALLAGVGAATVAYRRRRANRSA